jgi:hypothetical protein
MLPERPINATAHGVIDWGLMTSMIAGPHALRLNRRAKVMGLVFGTSIGAVNAFTNHRPGLVKLMSMRQHGWLELSAGIPYLLLPLATGAVKDERARTAWLAQFAALLAIYGLTEWGEGEAAQRSRGGRVSD